MTTPPPGDRPWPPPGDPSGQPAGPPPPPSAAYDPSGPPPGGPAPASSPYGQPGYPQLPWSEPVEEPGSSLRERAIYVSVAAAAGIVFGIIGGWLWSVVADPPIGVLTDRGVFLTDELSYNQQVLMTLWFLIVGAGLGLVAGAVFGLRGRRHGVTVVVAVLVLTAIAAALSAWLGIHVFGPDPEAQIANSDVGDPITSALDIETFVAYLGWPIGGLLGVLATVSTWRQAKPTHSPWPSTNVSPH